MWILAPGLSFRNWTPFCSSARSAGRMFHFAVSKLTRSASSFLTAGAGAGAATTGAGAGGGATALGSATVTVAAS